MADAKPVLIVDNDAAKAAAQLIVGAVYEVASRNDDITAWRGRKCLLWPNATAESRSAFEELATVLAIVCPEVKRLNVEDCANGEGPVACAGWEYVRWREWAAPRATVTLPLPSVVLSDGPTLVAVAPSDAGDTPSPSGTASHLLTWQDLGLALSGSGQPMPNLDNALRVLERHDSCRTLAWYDGFYQRLFTGARATPREWTDADTIELCAAWQRHLGLARMTPAIVYDALNAFCRRTASNALVEWLDSLAWDGVQRLESFWTDLVGAPSDEYHMAVGRNFWLQLAARAYQPGCRAQHVVYLIGPQGKGKSTALEILGGAWHTEAAASVLDKDFYLALRGKLLVEIAELASFRRADQEQVKAVITRRVDTYRAPYERAAADHLRRCVFVCTTNEATPFTDPTGARRFWPIACPAPLDFDYATSQREQLFAEARTRYKAGEEWWEVPGAMTAAVQEACRQRDPWEEYLADFLLTLNGVVWVTPKQLLEEGLKLRPEQVNRTSEMRIASIMRGFGWPIARKTISGRQARVYLRPEES